MQRRQLIAAASAPWLALAACHPLVPAHNQQSEVPESAVSLLTEGSARACTATEVQDGLLRQFAPDPRAAGAIPGVTPAIAQAAVAAVHLLVSDINLASADASAMGVTCDARLTLTAPDYNLPAPQPIAIRYTARVVSAASSVIDVRLDGTAGRAAAQALYGQVLQAIAQRAGTPTPIAPGYDGPVAAPTAAPDADLPDAADPIPTPAPAPEPREPDTATYNPSFDCTAATSSALATICRDPQLSALDRRLTGLYRRRLAEATADSDEARDELQSTERDWIADRRSCGSDADCLEDHYRQRISDLSDD